MCGSGFVVRKDGEDIRSGYFMLLQLIFIRPNVIRPLDRYQNS